MTSRTSSKVAGLATETGVLKKRSRLTLIGVMGSKSAPRALLMTGSGRTLRVQLGDRTPSGKVIAIDGQSIVLHSGQGATRLSMPR
ncbi:MULTISPECIES: hypothetical protein [unclassified Shimia]|uniref:hypothetical protein n=1 Tax=unclassified Shimia TaxID=2630038 RepID=UPI001ADA2AB7|nr:MULTISPECIES: hypothetical protein [unclassified Shimia]MBO9475115.1 hypothetical protein [Shimia sp. R10_1]MDA5557892.1 hypothetical protein [Shimia sp. MMG029]